MGVIKALLAPGSLALLTLALVAGLVLRRARSPRAARIWTAVWLAAYVALSLPVVARALYHGLASSYAPLNARTAAGAGPAIVVLSGGAARYRLGEDVVDVMATPIALRAREAARAYRMMQGPTVYVSGAGPRGARAPDALAMRQKLIESGVPADRIVIEADSRDTYQSALAVRGLLTASGISRPVLVTSAQHMHRAVRAFHAQTIDVVPAPAPVLPAGRLPAWRLILPDTSGLSLSELCLHEYAGIVYYWLRGWT